MDRDRSLRLVTLGAEVVQRYIAPKQGDSLEPDVSINETQPPQYGPSPQPIANSLDRAKPSRTSKTRQGKRIADETPSNVKHEEIDRTEAQELARLFRRACQSHRIQIDECDPARAARGPNVWRFYVRLRSGERLDKLRSALEDISREMQRSGVLVAPLPNSNEIALDVPRMQRQIVPLARGLDKLPTLPSIEQMPIAIGVTPEGADIIYDLSEMPHLLVGGTTGSGKTIFLYGLMAALLKTHPDPETLRLFVSTSKPEDFTFFRELRHLETGIVSNADEAVRYLQTRAQEELEVRQRRLSEARCRDIIEYNRTHKPAMPPLVVLVDEFADLADQLAHDRTSRETFYRAIRQIAQMGRNKGMHLVLCTQRPSADLVPTNIRTLMNFRVALHVNDVVASRMVLEEAGAEQLQFQGDLLFKTTNTLMRAQGYFVETREIDRLIAALQQR